MYYFFRLTFLIESNIEDLMAYERLESMARESGHWLNHSLGRKLHTKLLQVHRN